MRTAVLYPTCDDTDRTHVSLAMFIQVLQCFDVEFTQHLTHSFPHPIPSLLAHPTSTQGVSATLHPLFLHKPISFYISGLCLIDSGGCYHSSILYNPLVVCVYIDRLLVFLARDRQIFSCKVMMASSGLVAPFSVTTVSVSSVSAATEMLACCSNQSFTLPARQPGTMTDGHCL